MEETKAIPEKEKIFRPRRRRLLDLLLLANCLVMILFAFHPIHAFSLGILCLSMSSLLVLLWFFIITPLMTIKIVSNTISGRDGKGMMQTIPFRKIHFTNTIVSPEGMKRIFFKDIHSLDGKIIRIHRQFLGEGQVNKIIVTIERYPFRDGTT